MADRQVSPKQQRTLTANAVFLALAAIFAAPALAATSSRIPCSEAVEVTFNVAFETLVTATVGHDVPAPSIMGKSSLDEISVVSSTNLLVPRAENAIRDAFAEIDSATLNSPVTDLSNAVLAAPPMAGAESKSEANEADEKGIVSGMNTKFPGISDDAMSRYRKQMFRRDI